MTTFSRTNLFHPWLLWNVEFSGLNVFRHELEATHILPILDGFQSCMFFWWEGVTWEKEEENLCWNGSVSYAFAMWQEI